VKHWIIYDLQWKGMDVLKWKEEMDGMMDGRNGWMEIITRVIGLKEKFRPGVYFMKQWHARER